MRVLVVDDDESVRSVCTAILQRQGYDVAVAAGGREAWERYRETPFPVVVTDLQMPEGDGFELLRRIRSTYNGSAGAVILMSGIADSDTVGRAYADGAFEFLSKPASLEQLSTAVGRAQVFVRSRGAAQGEPPPLSDDVVERVGRTHGIQIVSSHMREVVQLALIFHRVPSAPVLIQGETGTGKECIARLIHDGIDGSSAPFVDLNCAAISPHLMESELFGYESGAFTGARSDGLPGKFELAQGGTIFLDEVGEMPLELQSKLLRVLEQREIRRVGGARSHSVDVRVVCAGNRDLCELVRQGRFRSDLYYRLNVGVIRLRPLRERNGAIKALAQAFMKTHAGALGRAFRHIHPDTIEHLKAHHWPGNIRELRNAIHRAVLLHDAPVLEPQHLDLAPLEKRADRQPQGTEPPVLTPETLQLPEEGIDLEKLEAEIVRRALEHNDYNKSRTARYLGLTRSKLLTRLVRPHPER